MGSGKLTTGYLVFMASSTPQELLANAETRLAELRAQGFSQVDFKRGLLRFMGKEPIEFERGMRVQISDSPKCGLKPGAKGVLDLFGPCHELDGEWAAVVIVDGGGACGPYRQGDITEVRAVV